MSISPRSYLFDTCTTKGKGPIRHDRIGGIDSAVVRRWILVLVGAVVAATLAAGLTDGYGTGKRIAAGVGGWIPDGAKADTFWDSPVVDAPGFSVTTVHCHGRMQLDLQLGATGPSHNNPCYAAMGMYSGQSDELDAYMSVPFVGKVLYRRSSNYGPWAYSIGNPITAAPPPTN
jgi:hypothetical protein